jgi:hypothetical protein
MVQNSNPAFPSPKRGSSKIYTPQSMIISPRYRTSYQEETDDSSTSLSAPGRDRRDLFHRAWSHGGAVAVGTLLDGIASDDTKGKSSGLVTTRHGGLSRAVSEAQVGALQKDAVKARIMREYHELTHGRTSAPELNAKSKNMSYSGLLQELQELMNGSQPAPELNAKNNSRNMPYSGLLQEVKELRNES